MKFHLPLLLAALLACCQDAAAYRLELQGLVTEYGTLQPLPSARVRIYKDGKLQSLRRTNAMGTYSIVLDNHAAYVVRVDAPGFQTKCITVDTQGLEWEGDRRTSRVEVEMRLPRLGRGVDLSYFDLPMGMARFEPATGLTRWNIAYEGQVLSGARAVMDRYDQRCRELGLHLPARGMDLGALYVREANGRTGL